MRETRLYLGVNTTRPFFQSEELLAGVRAHTHNRTLFFNKHFGDLSILCSVSVRLLLVFLNPILSYDVPYHLPPHFPHLLVCKRALPLSLPNVCILCPGGGVVTPTNFFFLITTCCSS